MPNPIQNPIVQSYFKYKWQVKHSREGGALRVPMTGETYITQQTHRAYRKEGDKLVPYPPGDIHKGTKLVWNVFEWLRVRS